MDYNTQRNKLVMPEYGRAIQQMVEHCKTIEDREERMRCAKSIFTTMANVSERNTEKDDFEKKLWNHLAKISGYELDIDYPVEIVQEEVANAHPDKLKYPQTKIRKRNYGAIVQSFTDYLKGMENCESQKELSMLIANHMKRDLSNWSVDSMSDERVIDDLAQYTDGKIQIDLNRDHLISDGELLSSRISTSLKKKKKK